MTMRSTLEQAGGSTKSRGEPVAFVAIVFVHELGKQPLDDKKLEFLALFTVRPFVIFLSFRRPVSVGRQINFPTKDGGVDRTPLTRHILARTAHHRTHRTDVSLMQHAWLKSFALVCQK